MHPYLSHHYASAFPAPFEPIELACSKSWILKRPIPGSQHMDAMGCYPIFPIEDGEALRRDMAQLVQTGTVSFVAVSDVFLQPEPAVLTGIFDAVTPYKTHYLYDFSLPEGRYSKHHRYEVNRSRRFCEVREFVLKEELDRWYALYQHLIERHHITGIQAFSRDYFAQLSAMNTLTAIGAFAEGELISAHLWMEYHGYVYSHLAASNEAGYQARAAYAIYDQTIAHFRKKGAKAIDFGGGAGTHGASGGLSFFKQGFSNQERACYLCGKVLAPSVYEQLSRGKVTNFFPAYRG